MAFYPHFPIRGNYSNEQRCSLTRTGRQNLKTSRRLSGGRFFFPFFFLSFFFGDKGIGEEEDEERTGLSTGAPANCLAHELMGCRWTGSGSGSGSSSAASGVFGASARQTTARFDGGFFFFSFFFFLFPPPLLPPPHHCSPLEVSAGVTSGSAVMDWHPASVKTALWLFNEAISQRGASADTGRSGFLNRKSKKRKKKKVRFHSGVLLEWPDCRRCPDSRKKKKKKNQTDTFSTWRRMKVLVS